MATLVLSTVGTALGGPVGSAIGALIGQSIDRELLAPTRRGPRVGDLSVQTSSYGTEIPRLYGTLRVAGSVIWSTDLVEHPSTGGAKGQPDVSYSYTVSLAVALSSRTAGSVKRIWADGKLLRGAAGDFKVGTKFRFHDGGEDQAIDPLIGSVEGIANCPAYRGLALAVFEDLELGEFGNRIPFLTFEVEADDGAVALGQVLRDASGGLISCEAEQTLGGFAAYGRSIRSAVEPLADIFDIGLFDDGDVLRAADSAAQIAIDDAELGNSVDAKAAPRLEREQLSARSAAAAVRLTYYDPARDYQTGEARASTGESGGTEMQQDLAAALTAGEAKSLAQQVLARSWANRSKLTLRLPPSRLPIEPGRVVQVATNPPSWVVEKTTIESFAVVAELRPARRGELSVAADSGRLNVNPDIVDAPLSLALLDLPNPWGATTPGPSMLLAASCPTAGWKQRGIQITFGGESMPTRTARAKSSLGSALTLLPPGGTDLIDERNSVEVQLVDEDQWLTSCDNDALAGGTNLAALGSELIQFSEATPLGSGRFRIGRLLRGRGGTEWACDQHRAGELFCMIEPAALNVVALPSWSIGSAVTAAGGSGNASSEFGGESLRPPSPVDLSARRQANGDLAIGWTRRSRLGFAWIDGVDAPLGESTEAYLVVVSGSSTSFEVRVQQPNLTIAAADLGALGTGPATVAVRQIGDQALSRPTQLDIDIS